MITKRDLKCEIKELELEIKDHETAIQNLNNIKERKLKQLNKFPISLERIIAECMVGYNNMIQPELLENILDRVEVEFLSVKPYEINLYYGEGWEDCVRELKKRLRE
jgi:hypothetical protein